MSKHHKKVLNNGERALLLTDRQSGFSYPELVTKYGVSFRYAYDLCKGVRVSDEYFEFWKSKRGGSRKIANQHYMKEFESLLKFFNGKRFSYTEKLLLVTALYWAEGTKNDLSFSNSDPRMVKIFVRLLSEVFDISKEKFRLSVRIYSSLDKDKCVSFWESITGLKVRSVNVLEGKKVTKLKYGMCRVRVEKASVYLKKLKACAEVLSGMLAPIAQEDRAVVS